MSNLTVDTFKQVFNINADFQDVYFQKLYVGPYNSLRQNHEFGEKVCVLYQVEFTIFNITVGLKILTFKYDNHSEILKLDIKIYNDFLSKEIAPCRNFLQRKRNLNLAFEVLIKCAQLFEMRRLICLTVFGKYRSITTMSDDEGLVVKFYNHNSTIKYLEFNWAISWKIDNYEISDFIEFYFNYRVLDKQVSDSVRKKLELLVDINIDFHTKLKIWKSVLTDFYGDSLDLLDTTKTPVLEISDSESEDSVLEVDKSLNKTDEVLLIE